MRLLVTTNARLWKTENNQYFTPLVYGYDFFKRYLNVFDTIRLVAHVEKASDEDVKKMLLVSGPGLEVFEMPFPHGGKAYLKVAHMIGRLAKDCVKGCDAALFRVPDPLAFQIFPKARKAQMPIAIEVTSDPLELYSSKGGRYPLRLIIKWSHYWILKFCCRKANCVSYVTSTYLQSVYPSGIKDGDNTRFESHYTTAGIDEHENPVREYPITGKITLLHVSGSIAGKVKGHKELIESFVELRKQGFELQLVLAGGGKLDDDIAFTLEKSGYKDDVTFTGLVGKERLALLYKESDVFVFPSYREGLPRVVIEAMSWGLPCVCSDIPGCRELLPEKALVPIKDTNALSNRLKELLLNPKLMEEEGRFNATESKQYLQSAIIEVRDVFYMNLKRLVGENSVVR